MKLIRLPSINTINKPTQLQVVATWFFYLLMISLPSFAYCADPEEKQEEKHTPPQTHPLSPTTPQTEKLESKPKPITNNKIADELLENEYGSYMTVYKQKNWQYLREQTYVILGVSVLTAGLMTLLPESFTKWKKEDLAFNKIGTNWLHNVSTGPVLDEDDHFVNYVTHPYFGGIYYVAARNSGFDQFDSFLYSAFLSTFFWEYGVEATAELPSWQDLIVTPVFGAILGEFMFQAERSILANNEELLGSKTIGHISLFFLNITGYAHHLVYKSWRDKGIDVKVSLDKLKSHNQNNSQFNPLPLSQNHRQVGLNINVSF